MPKMNKLDITALVLVIIGAINWGLLGIAQYNIIETIFGGLSRFIYVIVGLSGIYAIYSLLMK